MLRTKLQNENERRASIMPIVVVLEHCTSPQRDLPMKFHVYALHSFKVMLRTKKDGRTDRRTDGRTSRLLYATLRGGGITIL